jgi:hypothetical protein
VSTISEVGLALLLSSVLLVGLYWRRHVKRNDPHEHRRGARRGHQPLRTSETEISVFTEQLHSPPTDWVSLHLHNGRISSSRRLFESDSPLYTPASRKQGAVRVCSYRYSDTASGRSLGITQPK